MNILKIVLFIFVIGLNSIQAQPDTVESDSLNQTEHLKSLHERVDSLEKEINKHQIKEGFFDSIISSQASVYNTILVILIALGGFFSYTAIRRLTKDIRERQDELETNLLNLESDHLETSQKSYSLIAEREEDEYLKSVMLLNSVGFAYDRLEMMNKYSGKIKDYDESISKQKHDLNYTLDQLLLSLAWEEGDLDAQFLKENYAYPKLFEITKLNDKELAEKAERIIQVIITNSFNQDSE